MNKKELVKDMPNINNNAQICDTCQQGKQAKLPFPKNQVWRANQKLQLIHIDVCAPMKTTSLIGTNISLLVTILGCVGFTSLNSRMKSLLFLNN